MHEASGQVSIQQDGAGYGLPVPAVVLDTDKGEKMDDWWRVEW